MNWREPEFAPAGIGEVGLAIGQGTKNCSRLTGGRHGFGLMPDDDETLVKTAKSENPSLPIYMLGHSAGGVTACVYALDHQSEIDGLICESFAFELPVPDIVLTFLKGLSYITPHTHVFSLKNKDFSRDLAVVESMNNDIFIKGESQPAQTAKTMLDASARLTKEFPNITLRCFIRRAVQNQNGKRDV